MVLALLISWVAAVVFIPYLGYRLLQRGRETQARGIQLRQVLKPAEVVVDASLLFALLLVPNALLARIFVGTRIGGRFLAGSAVALSGIGLLLVILVLVGRERLLRPALWIGRRA